MNHINPVFHMKDHVDGAGYYFLDETWTETHGPYADEKEATAKMKQYLDELNRPAEIEAVDTLDFWENEFEEARAEEIISPLPSDSQREVAWEQDYSIQANVPIKRLEIKEIKDLFEVEGLIDGGYLSFIYGSRKIAFGGWNNVKSKYARYLMLLDSTGVRQNEYPLYKSRRNERRDQYDYMRQTYEQVQLFREILKNDPMVNTARIDGYEADDLIALLFLKGIGTEKVIAQDKDFFQVKGLREAMTDHTGIPQSHRDLKLPKYAIPPDRPATWALTQAIFGDKSDSIPRLLPSRVGYREVYSSVIRTAPNLISAFWNCQAEFGDQFEINLRLVLLPHPTLADQDYGITHLLFDDVCSGYYWDPNNYDNEILQEVVDSMGDMTW